MTFAGRLSLPLENLQNTIADAAAFRTLTSETTRSGAVDHIFVGGAGESETPPMCIIRLMEGELTEKLSTTGWSGSGPIRMFFVLQDPNSGDWNADYITIANTIGTILDQMQELARNPGSGPYLNITNISLDGLGQWDKDQQGESFWEAEFTVNWRGM